MSASTGVVAVAFFCNLVVALALFAATALSGAAAMLAAAIHAFAGASAQALLLAGLQRARRQPDEGYPFGYGREIYFWSFIVAVLLFSMGAGASIYAGVARLAEPQPAGNPLVSYVALGAAMGMQALATWKATRGGGRGRPRMGLLATLRGSRDPARFTVVLECFAALLGLAVAFAGIASADRLGGVPGDGIAAVAIGLVMAALAAGLSIEVKRLIAGEAAEESVRQGLRNIVEAESGDGKPIRAVDEVRAIHLGPCDVLVAARFDVREGETARAVETAAGRMQSAMRVKYPEVQRLFVEVRSQDVSGVAAPVEEHAPQVPEPPGAPASERAVAALSQPEVRPVIVSRPPLRKGKKGKRRH